MRFLNTLLCATQSGSFDGNTSCWISQNAAKMPELHTKAKRQADLTFAPKRIQSFPTFVFLRQNSRQIYLSTLYWKNSLPRERKREMLLALPILRILDKFFEKAVARARKELAFISLSSEPRLRSPFRLPVFLKILTSLHPDGSL